MFDEGANRMVGSKWKYGHRGLHGASFKECCGYIG
jgi:hypothetical protein